MKSSAIPRPWSTALILTLAAMAMAAALFLANAPDTGAASTPETPANPLAHVIVPDGEAPRIRVSWDPPAGDITGYTIARSSGETFQTGGPATTYSDLAVNPGTAYSYTVSARNGNGTSGPSDPASARMPDAPTAPSNLAAQAAEPELTDETATVTITWPAATVPEPGECETAHPLDGYTVWRVENGAETELGSPDSGATSFTDSTAAFGTAYTYRVAARNAAGSSPAAAAGITTPPRPVGTPTGLTAALASDPFDGAITLSWEEPAEGPRPTGYRVERSTGAGRETLAGQHPGTSYQDTAARPGRVHQYQVTALTADNGSERSNIATIEPPAAPASLSAQADGPAVTLSWPPPEQGSVLSYRLERQTGGGQWTKVADTGATSHRDDGAPTDSSHLYRVQNRNAYGGSAWTTSNPVSTLSVPGAPLSLSAQVSGDGIRVSWQPPETGRVDGYHLRYGPEGTGEFDTANLDAGETSFVHTDNEEGVPYAYQVRARNEAGNGPWSGAAVITRINPPGIPQNVNVSLDGNGILLSWERPDSVSVDGYSVRHAQGDGEYTVSGRLPGSQASFRITEAQGDVPYRLSVRAHNGAGDSPWSSEVQVMRRLPPSAPTGVAAAAGETSIVLSWRAPETGTPDGYHAEYGELDSGERATANLAADARSFVHSGNTEGVTYRYRVRAYNTAGQGPWSGAVTASRTLAPPAPAGLMTQVSGSLITLSWTAPATGVVDFYEVEYGVLDSGETSTSTIDAGETGFEHTAAQGDVTHRYRVRSVNSAGHSPWAGPVEARWIIPPGVPANVHADTDGDDILISWDRPASAFIDEYHLEHRQYNTQDWTRTVVAADQTSHRHAGPTPGTAYEYRVRTVNAGGVSEWSPTATGVRYDTAAPPAQFIYTPIGTNRILVKWTASTTPDIQRYQLRHSSGGGWTEVNIPKRQPYHIANWTTEQEYFEFQIRARKDGQYGDWSPVSRAYVSIPDAVTSLRANPESSSGVRLHWEHPASGIPHTYRVQRLQDGGSYADTGVTAAGSQTTRSFLDTSGATGTYRVVAVNHAGLLGEHAESATATMTVPGTIRVWPDMPRNLTVMMLDPSTVKLNWYEPAEHASDVDAYRIYRKQADDSRRLGASYQHHVLAALTGNAGTHYIDHTAQPGVTYEYGVAAYWDGAYHPLGQISNRAYARPWE